MEPWGLGHSDSLYSGWAVLLGQQSFSLPVVGSFAATPDGFTGFRRCLPMQPPFPEPNPLMRVSGYVVLRLMRLPPASAWAECNGGSLKTTIASKRTKAGDVPVLVLRSRDAFYQSGDGNGRLPALGTRPPDAR